jgi:NADH:ubiquinone oxidoreductase subunit K
MFYGVNFFLVALSVYLDDMMGELFALFVLTLAAAESALALALITVYISVYTEIFYFKKNKCILSLFLLLTH